MLRVAFKMQLFKGKEAEYQKRHEGIWPELSQLLKEAGISEYSIYLDESTSTLFGVFSANNGTMLDSLSGHPVMQRWWKYMSDIMQTNPDNSPVSVQLREVFYLH